MPTKQLGFPDPELDQFARQREYAKMLRDKAFADSPTGEMVSGIYVPRDDSWSKFAQAAVGGWNDARAQGGESALVGQREAQFQDFLRKRPSMTTEQTVPGLVRPAGNNPDEEGSYQAPDTTEQVMKPWQQQQQEQSDWALQGMQMRHPLAQAMGVKAYESSVDIPEKAMAREEVRQARIDEAKQKHLDKMEAIDREFRNGLITKEQAIRLANESKMALAQFGRDTQLLVKSLDVGRKSEAAADKAKTKEVEKQESKDSALRIIDNMSENIDTLEKGSGLVSKEKGAVSNVGSYLANLPAGQEVQRMVGGRNQAERDMLESRRMQLLTELKKAKGLSASEMNSNFELQKRLEALGGGRMEVGALKEIMDDTRQMFGGQRKYGVHSPAGQGAKGKIGPAAPAAPVGNVPPGWTPEEWGALTPEEKASLGK